MTKKMIPILCEWELPAREGTCQANQRGIPESWFDDSRQPTPGALTRDPRLIFLRRPKEEPSQQRWLPRYPEGPVLAPSDTLVVYEIEVKDLAPGEVDLLQFCLFQIVHVRHRPTNVKSRQRAIERLHDDKELATLVAQKVLGGVSVSALLEPKQLGRLFAHSVGERTLERDVAHVRKHASARTKHETTVDQNGLVANTALHEPVQAQAADGAGVQSKDITHTPHTSDTEAIHPGKPAPPELEDQSTKRAGAPEDNSLHDTGDADTETHVLNESGNDVARTSKDATSAPTQADASSDATPSHAASTQQEALGTPTGLREHSQESAVSNSAPPTDGALIQAESHPESKAGTAEQSEIDTRAQSLTPKPESSAASTKFESDTLASLKGAAPSEGPINSYAERTDTSEQPTEESVAPVVAKIRQAVLELPPADELFAIVRQHEGEQKVKKLLQWLDGKKDAVETPNQCLDAGKKLLQRLGKLTDGSGTSTEERSQ
ncbi:hypothetical protein [Guyparkeria sp.]|uniref:hypothetical protein n=1 Tax=Guyparkeria sp. TaxID=2035736 RepID=UPI003970D49F